MLAAALLACLSVMPQPEYEMTTYTFGLLVTGSTPLPAERAEVMEMQTAHIDNFKRLHGKGRLLTAGPMADPERKLRGIVVLDLKEGDKLKDLFKPDPYVTKGHMDLVTMKWMTAKGRIGGEPDPEKIVENRIVFLKKTDANIAKHNAKEISDMQMGHLSGMEKALKDKVLALSGPVLDDKTYAGIWICHGTQDEKIQAWIKSDPLISAGLLKPVVMPLWLSDGVLPKPGT